MHSDGQPAAAGRGREFGELLDDLVHELRTPLTVIAGYAALLMEDGGTLDPLVRQWVTSIDQQSTRLGGQLGVLLDLARLWSGKRMVVASRFDLAGLGRTLARARGMESDTAPRLYVSADRVLVETAAGILLDNALVYGAPPILVRTCRGDGMTMLVVEDSGPGVPGEFAALIGKRPFRGGEEERQREGSGCRLLLAAAIAEAHGGELRYQRAAGATRFILALPSPPTDRRARAG